MGSKSETMTMSYGVTQRSVLGPLMFIMYSNDIPNSLTNCKTTLFADDTTIYMAGETLKTLYKQVNIDLSSLTDWFMANQLSFNLSKTKYYFLKACDADTRNHVP